MSPLKKTPLYDEHLAQGARMTGFGGYNMPLQYPKGILAEHLWTRQSAGLFDISHMGPSKLSLRHSHQTSDGSSKYDRLAGILEPFILSDIRSMKPGLMRYGLLLNETGGIKDDLILARVNISADSQDKHDANLFLIANAGTKEADFAYVQDQIGQDVILERWDEGCFLALQGPKAMAVLESIFPEIILSKIRALGFMRCDLLSFEKQPILLCRSGYSGEDGFEILTSADFGRKLWIRLLEDERVQPIGLGARDSLRLEAGLPLYGQDLDETTSPIEANLGFVLTKRRREETHFLGQNRILRERETGPDRLLVGLRLSNGPPARPGADILNLDGKVIGKVTSGAPSPCLGGAIALGYVPPEFAGSDQVLQVCVRDKVYPVQITPLPFVPHRYVRKP